MHLSIFCIVSCILSHLVLNGATGADAEVELSVVAAGLNPSLQLELQRQAYKASCTHIPAQAFRQALRSIILPQACANNASSTGFGCHHKLRGSICRGLCSSAAKVSRGELPENYGRNFVGASLSFSYLHIC